MKKPDRDHIITFVKVLATVLPIFLLVYLGVNAWSHYYGHHHHFYLEWEPNIPLVDFMIIPYAGTYIIPLTFMYLLTPKQMKILGKSMVFAVLCAGIIFIVYPTTLGYHRVPVEGIFGPAYRLLHFLDYPYNLFPSVHIIFACQWTWCIWHGRTPFFKLILTLILLSIMASVILTHQHHLIDIPAGALIAWLYHHFYYQRKIAYS